MQPYIRRSVGWQQDVSASPWMLYIQSVPTFKPSAWLLVSIIPAYCARLCVMPSAQGCCILLTHPCTSLRVSTNPRHLAVDLLLSAVSPQGLPQRINSVHLTLSSVSSPLTPIRILDFVELKVVKNPDFKQHYCCKHDHSEVPLSNLLYYFLKWLIHISFSSTNVALSLLLHAFAARLQDMRRKK